MAYGIGGMSNGGMYGGQMSMMGMNSMGVQGSGNMHQYFKGKYGCETCLKQVPTPRILPLEVLPMTKEEVNPSFFKRLMNRIFG